jgi:outer membrane protein TolC
MKSPKLTLRPTTAHLALAVALVFGSGALPTARAVESENVPPNFIEAQKPSSDESPCNFPVQPTSAHPQKYTLPEFLDAVMARSPEIVSAQLGADATNYAYKSARVAYFPKLTAVGQTSFIKGSVFDPLTTFPTFVNPTVQGYTDGGGGVLTIPFFEDGTFLGINTPPKASMVLADKKVADATVILTRDDIRYHCIGIYLQAIAAHREAAALLPEVEAIRKQVQILRIKQSYHLVSEAEITTSQAQFAQAAALFEQAQWLAASALFQVAMVLGVDDPHAIQIKDEYPEMNPNIDYQDVLTRSLSNHPKLNLQQALLEKAEAKHTLDQSAFLPTAEIHGLYTYVDDYAPPGQDRWQAQMAVSLPIFDFGENYYKVRSSEKDVEMEKKNLYAAKEEVESDVQAAYKAIEDAGVTYTTDQVAMLQKQLAVKKMDVMSQSGQAPTDDYLTARIDYALAAYATEEAHYDYLLSYAALEKASSGAWKMTPQ